jgi:rhodanese-related sulfurtransferase
MKGIKHFMVLVGIVFWVKSSFGQTKISNSQFKTLAMNTDAVILDVRTPEEFAEGHINGQAKTLNLNYFANDFVSKVSAKVKKDQFVLVYCAAGGRSASACKDLKKAGFKKIYDLEGGYNNWE